MIGPFVPHDPAWDGIVAVTVDGFLKCGAVLISPRLALSVASCFLSLPLSSAAQEACLRGPCTGAVLDSARVRLVGGPDARLGVVVARVTHIAVRFTAHWAIPQCTTAVCGEGWDVALLQLDPSCDHGPLPCISPLRVATIPSSIGLVPTAVGFGANPSFDRRAEWSLNLAANGTGVRRSVQASVWQVASKQRLATDVGIASGERRGPFCAGDHGAALVSQRNGQWQVDGLAIPSAAPAAAAAQAGAAMPEAAACMNADSSAWSIYASRCWIESVARRWGQPPVEAAHATECGGLDFYPPELDADYLGGGGDDGGTDGIDYLGDGGPAAALAAAAASNCSITSCEIGVCADGRCVCADGVFGPRCTVRGPPPTFATAFLPAIQLSPSGADSDACGDAAEPCRTLRHALERQFWQGHLGGGWVPLRLQPGTYAGEGNRELVLHGVRVVITSTDDASRGVNPSVLVDCRHPMDQAWGMLFMRGASPLVTLQGLSLRKCLTAEQTQQALSAHPAWAAHVAGAERWPAERDGVVYRQNTWLVE